MYQATNWIFYGLTSPVNYLVRPDGKRVDPKLIHKYAKKIGITSQEQRQKFIEEGYTFEKGSPKLKYLLVFGSKSDIRYFKKNIKVKSYPYLKRLENMKEVYSIFKDFKKGSK